MKFFKKLKNTFWGDEPIKGGSALFVCFVSLSVVATIVANILANKLIPMGSWTATHTYISPYTGESERAQITLTCGVLIFPLTYVLSDLFSDVYGYSASRRVTWLAFFVNLIIDIFFIIAEFIPVPTFQDLVNGQYEKGSFNTFWSGVLGCDFSNGNLGSFGTLIASFVAFIIGSWIDDLVFEKIRTTTSKKHKGEENEKRGLFTLRAIVSSAAGELCDSIIFIPLMYLFKGLMYQYNAWDVIMMILLQCAIKVTFELIISPLTHLIVMKTRKYEKNHNAELKVRED